jgi:hypothetical protein
MSLYLHEKSKLSFISGFSLGGVWLDDVFNTLPVHSILGPKPALMVIRALSLMGCMGFGHSFCPERSRLTFVRVALDRSR